MKTYTVGEVAEITGVNRSTLRAWIARGIITVSKTQPYTWTRYTEADLNYVKRVVQLSKLGMRLKAAAKLASGVRP